VSDTTLDYQLATLAASEARAQTAERERDHYEQRCTEYREAAVARMRELDDAIIARDQQREHAERLERELQAANVLLRDVLSTDAAAYEAARVVLHCQRQPTKQEDEAMRDTARARLAVINRVGANLRGGTPTDTTTATKQ